jgi:signal peptidase I
LNVLDRVRQSKHARTIISMVLTVALVLGFFFSLPLVLGVSIPVRVVESGSMCIPYGGACEGWLSISHEFNRTLHKGDIIIIQHVDPATLNTDYPNSDIIVYKKPTNPDDTPIVHRIVGSYEVNGTLYFQTKGDGNPTPWPAPVDPAQYDSNNGVWLQNAKVPWPTGEGVPEDLVEGKVILRIPYLGWVTLLFKAYPWVTPLIIGVILFLLALEVLFSRKKAINGTNQAFTI